MKRFHHVFFFVVILAINCIAQGTWTQKASLPGNARGDAMHFSIGTKGYIIGGADIVSNKFKDVWEYDALSNSWSQKQDFIGTGRWQAVSFSIGTKGYIGTGQDASSYNNDLWEYNSVFDTWTQKASIPPSGRNNAVGFSIGSKGYIGSGKWGSPALNRSDFWEYNSLSNTWTQKANMVGARSFAFGLSVGVKGYIGTGYDSTGPGKRDDFWEYDTTANLWTQKSNFPGGNSLDIDGGHFSIGSYCYVGTGNIASGYSNFFWRYDPMNDAWIQIANLSGLTRIGGSNFSINNKGYIGLGFTITPTSAALNDLWEYTPDSTESVNEINLDNYFSVYPNPTSGKIEVQSAKYKIENINVFNAIGEKVFETKNHKLDISNQPNGVYFIHISCKEGAAVKKIVLQR